MCVCVGRVVVVGGGERGERRRGKEEKTHKRTAFSFSALQSRRHFGLARKAIFDHIRFLTACVKSHNYPHDARIAFINKGLCICMHAAGQVELYKLFLYIWYCCFIDTDITDPPVSICCRSD